MRAVVTGGAGFLGSHLCERLLSEGIDVVCVDSFVTGRPANVEHLDGDRRFRLEAHDVTVPYAFDGDVDLVLHLASPASPPDYLARPTFTLNTGALGTINALELARRKDARFFLASTSEVYGDPLEHPQRETYWGNVNPVGPRSVYDEGKRFAEAMTIAYSREHGLSIRIARIFNTYGPRMREDDGRAVPTFVARALRDEALPVHGDGRQTRSLCFVDDLIEGIWRLVTSEVEGPLNLGNPEEVPVLALAELIRDLVGSRSPIDLTDRPVDDPQVRCPDISLARSTLGWEPVVTLREGLERTIDWARGSWTSG
jgi:dTDP-glucose 4,6-dehydratase